MSSRPASLLLSEAANRVLPAAHKVPGQDSLLIAGVIRARCPVTDGGSCLVVSPESAGDVSLSVTSIGLALEALTQKGVAILQFTMNSRALNTTGRRESVTVVNGELLAEGLFGNQGSVPPLTRVTVNGSSTELCAAAASGEFVRFIRKLKSVFRFVLIEGESLRLSPETVLLAQASDGVVLVVRQGTTAVENIAQAQHVAKNADLRLLGFVFESTRHRATAG